MADKGRDGMITRAQRQSALGWLRSLWSAQEGRAPIAEPLQSRRESGRERSRIDITAEMAEPPEGRRHRSHFPREVALLEHFEPAPGVVGQKLSNGEDAHTLAQDDGITQFMNWAGSANFINNTGTRWLGYPYLSELAQIQEYRIISQVFAEELTREWIEIIATDDKLKEKKKDKIKEIEDEFENFGVRDHFRENVMAEGLFGIGHLYVDIAGARDEREILASPLIISNKTIKKDMFRGFVRVEPVWTYPATYNSIDPLRGDFFRPQSWWVMGKEVNKSRMFSFVSREVPDLIKPIYQFGGISMTQLSMPSVNNWLETRQSVNALIDNFSTPALGTNFGAILGGGAVQGLWNRLAMFVNGKNNRSVFAYDKEGEEFSVVATPLSGLSELQAQAQEHMASSARQPLVKFAGLQPAGLNASSDGEIRMFYDTMEALKKIMMGDAVKTTLEIIQLNKYGEIDEDITYKFKSNWRLDDAGKAATEKTESDTDTQYYDMGAISGEEVRSLLSMKREGRYSGLDLDKSLPDEEPKEEDKIVNDPLAVHVERQSVEGGGFGGSGAASGV